MNDRINFLKPFNGKTVAEVIAILEKEEQEINNKQSLLQQKKTEWYKNCIGRYFVIDHNGTAFTLVHIMDKKQRETTYQNANNPLEFFTWECYSVVLPDSFTKPRIESNAGFNYLWLCNPYERSPQTSTCKEITKEKFERITSPFNSLINETKQILKTL